MKNPAIADRTSPNTFLSQNGEALTNGASSSVGDSITYDADRHPVSMTLADIMEQLEGAFAQ